MANKRMGGDDLNKRMDEDGVFKRGADDDVEGHVFKKSGPDDLNKRMDEDGLYKRSAADDDDVEGHMIGSMNPMLARDLAHAKERDVQRATSRNNLVSEAKRALRRKD